ncbi:MAG: metallophosphoesterase [Pyrinomonadaceae bacterium]|nr:metallophosphoesterase [Pyrinomonadaceae bacterium]
MNNFIVCPAITNDLDYYRFDDEIVQNALDGQNTLIIGLRRSGKTSFLLRAKRYAELQSKPCLFFDCRDFFLEENPSDQIVDAINKIKASSEAKILLDEIEVFENEDKSLLTNLIKACHKRTVLMTCAPKFVLEVSDYDSSVQGFIAECNRHQLGRLNEEEALALLSQKKRQGSSSLSSTDIEDILLTNDRLPIILQALANQKVGKANIRISLAAVGNYILGGLTEKVKELLILAAHHEPIAPESPERKLLEDLGALRPNQSHEKLTIQGETLKVLVRESSNIPNFIHNKGTSKSASKDTWELHSQILHLSDLHFGPHCNEEDEKVAVKPQFLRLKNALEENKIFPDFIAVTGDLSWSGHRDELKMAEDFLENLVKWLVNSKGLTDLQARYRILLVPGNHEAAWALTNGLEPGESKDWCCYCLAPFANMANRFYRGQAIWDLESACQIRSFEDPSVAFVSVSTAHSITREQKLGKFGNSVRETVKELLEKEEAKNALFRVALFHHNIRPFHNDGIVVRDGESFLAQISKCKPSIDLLLHGHVHQGEVESYKPRGGLSEVYYSAVGSFGVRGEHRPGDNLKGRVPNEFAVLDLETDETGRRFVTQFYQLNHKTDSTWKWEKGNKYPPVIL